MATPKTVEGIDLLVPSPWDRETIADGVWLNSNSIEPIFNNDAALASAIAKSSAAVLSSASKIYWQDDGSKTLKDVTFRNGDGSSYAAEFDDSGIDAHMVIPMFDDSDHENEKELWFGWNKDNGFDFYDAEHINSGCKNPDVSGSNYIKVEKVANQDGHDTYSASLDPSRFRSWRDVNDQDVGNILIQEKEVGNEKWIEFSAGAPAQGGGSTIWEKGDGSSQGSSSDTQKDIRYFQWDNEFEAVRVQTKDSDAEWPIYSSSDYDFVWPNKCEDHNDDALFYYNPRSGERRYGWIDASAVSRISIGVPAYNESILTII